MKNKAITTQMFGSRVYNYVFIDKEKTGQVRDDGEVAPAGRWTSSVYLADLLVLLFQEKLAP